MKSPLVEALRQASGDASPDKKPESADAGPAESPDGLALLDTMEILPIDGQDEAAPDAAVDELDLADTITGDEPGLDVAVPNPDKASPTRRGAGSTRVAAPRFGRRGTLDKLGGYAPLICLLLASATAAVHVLYRSAAGGLTAAPVASMPARAENDSGAPGAEGTTRFPLLRAADAESPPDSDNMVAQSPQGPPR